MPWTLWMGACWTAGSSAFRWPATDGQRRLHVVREEADETVVEAVANEADLGIGERVAGHARWNGAAEVDGAVGRTRVVIRAAATGPAREANLPAVRTPDRAVPLTVPTTKERGKDQPLIQPNNAAAAKL